MWKGHWRKEGRENKETRERRERKGKGKERGMRTRRRRRGRMNRGREADISPTSTVTLWGPLSLADGGGRGSPSEAYACPRCQPPGPLPGHPSHQFSLHPRLVPGRLTLDSLRVGIFLPMLGYRLSLREQAHLPLC